jgi:hypothetical protein
MNALFGEFESSMGLNDPPEVLTTYDVNDREEFM